MKGDTQVLAFALSIIILALLVIYLIVRSLVVK